MPKVKNNKLTVAIFSLTGCEGCCFAIIDLHEKLLALAGQVVIKQFRLFEEDVHLETEKFDIAFVEGSPLTAADIRKLKSIRANTKYLIALGSCAHIGGIYHLKQYQDKEKIEAYIYDDTEGIENFDVLPLREIVPVDFALPGCPITADEFLSFVSKLVVGKKPIIANRAVCHECQVNGYDCLLQKGEICLGPITLGGCGAICLKSKQSCWGCRGLVEDAEVANLIKELRQKYSEREIIKVFEVFGVKELMN